MPILTRLLVKADMTAQYIKNFSGCERIGMCCDECCPDPRLPGTDPYRIDKKTL
eukprot:m.14444 g.14444  ORF g.14444 m.14444 type:complete len:54 (-) comp10132_c0_seq1:200-361(-)